MKTNTTLALIENTIDSRNNDLPFYLYNADILRKTCSLFTSIEYEPKRIHFATMANINPGILAILKEQGLGVFVNSLEHLKIVKSVGFSQNEIIFTASATPKEVFSSLDDIEVNLDSLNQVRTWKSLFSGRPFGIRCNIGSISGSKKTNAGYFLGKASRLGLIPEEMEELSGDPLVQGLHLYAGTGLEDLDYFFTCYESLLNFAHCFPGLEYIDLGGGFGIRENCFCDSFENANSNIDFMEYGRRITSLLNDLSQELGRKVRLVLEPGRIVTASSGYFVCTVSDIKKREGIQLIGVNASSTQFPRPLFYPETGIHPVKVLGKDGPPVASKVFGCSTYSQDFLAHDTELPEVELGDRLIFANAGAYSASSHTQFLGFAKAEEIVLE